MNSKVKNQKPSAHALACRRARADILQDKLDCIRRWINIHPGMDFEVRSGKDLGVVFKRISLLTGMKVCDILHIIPGDYPKWRLYVKGWYAPKLDTLQIVSGALRIGIRVGYNYTIAPRFWLDGRETNFLSYYLTKKKSFDC